MRKPRSRNAGETTPRHVWLAAGLGVASLIRRDAMNTGGCMLAEAVWLQRRARGASERARSQVVAAARRQIDPIIAQFDDGAADQSR